MGFYKNVSTASTWRIRKLIAFALESCQMLENDAQSNLARAIILGTSQWALDNRRCVPSVSEFRDAFARNAIQSIDGAKEYSVKVKRASSELGLKKPLTPICLNCSAIGIEKERRVRNAGAPKLIITSPPYPGVHVLYHRWQVQGRRETPAPYWIANGVDGAGASHYTFGDRHDPHLKKYFQKAESAFRSIAEICGPKTLVVQMVSFAKPEWQLPAYLSMLNAAGFSELMSGFCKEDDGRVRRAVPNRRWYASWRKSIPSSSEVLLFHHIK